MFDDSELATLRNRFKKNAEFLMQTTASDEDEKSKLRKHCTRFCYWQALTIFLTEIPLT